MLFIISSYFYLYYFRFFSVSIRAVDENISRNIFYIRSTLSDFVPAVVGRALRPLRVCQGDGPYLLQLTAANRRKINSGINRARTERIHVYVINGRVQFLIETEYLLPAKIYRFN